MRIIKTGEIPNPEKNKTCGYCKTKFSFNPEDVKQDRDGSYVVCPHCGKFLQADHF